jgi:acyl-CoA reductase-like NAD-dependent aldehyde dehydrogenase
MRTERFRLLVGGELVDGAAESDVVDPATGEVCGQAPAASVAQLDLAVAAAEAARETWAATPMEVRAERVREIAATLEAHADELAELLTAEQGKPLAQARGEVQTAAEYTRYTAGLRIEPEIVEDSAQRRVEFRREPLGAVGAILPWNFPVLLLAFKLPAALLTGNTMVVKPAPGTPLATLRLGELLAPLLPAGVVNIVAGGNELGAALAAHPGIRKVTFTGSTATGAAVMRAAAVNLSRVTLELGGNDPAIVLDDADLDAVVPAIFAAAFGNSGQVCRAIKRVYVHDALYDRFCDHLATLAERAVVGPGTEPGVEFGPLQNEAQFAKVRGLLEAAERDATVLPGGGVVEGKGFFVRPTVVRDIDDDHPLVTEEQFGPVLPVLRFDDLDDVVARANAGDYGLAASVWSADVQRAYDVAARIDAGTVGVNKHTERDPALPIAGARKSGIGAELGQAGLLDYTQLKVVNSAPLT